MSDVASKIINANSIKTGTIVIKVNKNTYQTINEKIDSPSVSGLTKVLNTRFDDPQYYTA